MRAITWILLAICAGLYIVGPIQDPDLWWHIVVGRWIISHQNVPDVDYWSMFSQGQPWRAYSWSNEVIYALFDQYWHIEGLLILKMLLAIGISISVCYCLSKIASDWFLGLLLGVFTTTACFNHFTLRPQALIWIFFIWLIYQLDVLRRDGFTIKQALWIPILMLLWANTHLSAVLGIATIILWTYNHDEKNYYLVAKLVALGFIGTLFTPYLGGEWMTFFETSSHPFSFQSIAEFQPATIVQYSTVFLVLVSSLLLLLLHQNPKSLPISVLLLWGIFVLGSLAVIKFLPFAVIYSAACIARIWRHELHSPAQIQNNILESIRRLRLLSDMVLGNGLAFVLLCLCIVNAYKVWEDPFSYEVTPKLALDFIEDKKLPHPLLNIFGHGGYLMYRFSNQQGLPLYPVAIDGRTNLISPELWQKYNAAFRGRKNWREYFKEVNPETILWRLDSPLPAILLASGEWCQVFESGPGVASKINNHQVQVSPKKEALDVVVMVKRNYALGRASEFPSLDCPVNSAS